MKSHKHKSRHHAQSPTSHDIPIKKRYSQNFLRDQTVVNAALDAVKLDPTTNIFEIGCGDGFLTQAILQHDIARLWVFEIDADWVQHVQTTIQDPRLTVFHTNILDYDFAPMAAYKTWTLLANLPYQVTFPILYMLQRQRHLLNEGVVMVQEEVAQKIVKTSGRGYGYPSLFLQRYFDVRLLTKVAPSAFYPSPSVFSRLLYFKPRAYVAPIAQEDEFWQFIKICFRQPRRTLKNNLIQSTYRLDAVSEETLALRAQQMSMDDLIALWDTLLAVSGVKI